MHIQIYDPKPRDLVPEYMVWAEPEPGDKFIGLCVGVGATRQEALEDAVKGLEECMEQIQALGGKQEHAATIDT